MNITWSGFKSPYNEQTAGLAPSQAGVYLLWVKMQSGKWKCFYVGRSVDLRQRLLDHLSTSEPNGCIKTKVSKYVCGFEYALVSSQSDRDGIEKYLYDKYKPECNKVDPGGTPIEVNLP